MPTRYTQRNTVMNKATYPDHRHCTEHSRRAVEAAAAERAYSASLPPPPEPPYPPPQLDQARQVGPRFEQLPSGRDGYPLSPSSTMHTSW